MKIEENLGRALFTKMKSFIRLGAIVEKHRCIMRARLKRIAVRLGLLAFAIVVMRQTNAHADVILLNTGFEPSLYTQGPLLNQDGWTLSSVPIVQQATKFSGLQAVRFDANGLTGQSTARHLFSYESIGNPDSIVTFSIQAMITSAPTHSRWTILSVFSPGLFQTQINVHPNGITELRTGPGPQGGNVPFPFDVWNRFDLAIDMNTKLVTASLNGQSLGEKTLTNPDQTSLFQVGFGVNSVPGVDTGFFDDLRIASIPEPNSLLLVTLGAAIMMSLHFLKRSGKRVLHRLPMNQRN